MIRTLVIAAIALMLTSCSTLEAVGSGAWSRTAGIVGELAESGQDVTLVAISGERETKLFTVPRSCIQYAETKRVSGGRVTASSAAQAALCYAEIDAALMARERSIDADISPAPPAG